MKVSAGAVVAEVALAALCTRAGLAVATVAVSGAALVYVGAPVVVLAAVGTVVALVAPVLLAVRANRMVRLPATEPQPAPLRAIEGRRVLELEAAPSYVITDLTVTDRSTADTHH
ncbi:hypothetical protein MPTA5024_10780 [Microbispora sp. ATCC PTA-5024]|nr:hypothetical protein MPTA5024_10780 [Microbispora sp. ATCC PTA-5024]